MRRPLLLPLVPVYRAGQMLANALRPRPRELSWPVISVGSLSAGGAGKTPVVRMLAFLLAAHGVGCDVLSRGYGRGSGVVERVDPAGDAGRFGDEPMELARAGVEVWVGVERLAAGQAAEAEAASHGRDVENPSRTVHLLDDGFQHRRLGRTLDVVLLTLADSRDCLLPAGNLREPLDALRRADVLVVREEEAEALAPWVRGRTCWLIRRTMRLPPDAPERPVAFCGIARPETFFSGLAGIGVEVAGRVSFPDHYLYKGEDIDRLVAAAEHTGAGGFVTTAKDAVKLTDGMRRRLGRLAVANLEVMPADPEAVWGRLREALGPGFS